MFVVTHDLRMRSFATQTLYLLDGRLVEDGGEALLAEMFPSEEKHA